MPRTGRVLVPNYPHHIVQRGHNRHTVFSKNDDYWYYLDTLKKWKLEYEVRVYAYCLMTNHVHLLLQPPDKANRLSQLMKRLAGRQTRYANRLQGSSGTLWDGRYKSSPVQTDRYLLACCRYIELNPVRAGMVNHPREYLWSSYLLRLDISGTQWLDELPCFMLPGESVDDARARYTGFIEQDIPVSETTLIRTSLQRGQLTGDSGFIDEIERLTGRRVEHRAPGNQPRPGTK